MGWVAAVALWLVVAYLVVGEPLAGAVVYRRLRDGRLPRASLYRLTIALEVVVAAVALASALATGASPQGLGLTVGSYGALSGVGGGLALGAAVGGLLALALGALVRRGGRLRAPRAPVRLGEFDALLPETAGERRLFAAMALSAAVCEEIVYRAFLIYALSRVLPSLHPPEVVILAAVVFGLGHAYQGWPGVLGTALFGGLLGAIYVTTGSLLVPMALHALIDLRALTLAPPPRPSAPEGALGT